MNTPLAKRTEPPVLAMIAGMRDKIAAALPKHLTPNRMLRMALTCVRKTPRLAECEPLSVIACIVELSQLGLEPSTPLGHAWILPYGTKAQIIIGYKGFISLADRSGIRMRAEAVREDDKFDYVYGTDERLTHKPAEGESDSPLRYAYAIARFSDGSQMFRVCTRRDIARARSSSAAVKARKQDSPWFTDEDQMWRKTAIRRLAPFLPLSAEFVRAVTLDEGAQDGVQELSDDVMDAVTASLPTPADALADRAADTLAASRMSQTERIGDQ